MMKPHLSIVDDPVSASAPIAMTSKADIEQVIRVVSAPTEGGDGRSEWAWLRLANDDLALIVFPQGDTYEEMQAFSGHWGDGTAMRCLEGRDIPANDPIATIHPADPDLVSSLLELNLTDDIVPDWNWIRLANGDLALGVFHQGPLPDFLAADAAWPGLPNRNSEGDIHVTATARRRTRRHHHHFDRTPSSGDHREPEPRKG